MSQKVIVGMGYLKNKLWDIILHTFSKIILYHKEYKDVIERVWIWNIFIFNKQEIIIEMKSKA